MHSESITGICSNSIFSISETILIHKLGNRCKIILAVDLFPLLGSPYLRDISAAYDNDILFDPRKSLQRGEITTRPCESGVTSDAFE